MVIVTINLITLIDVGINAIIVISFIWDVGVLVDDVIVIIALDIGILVDLFFIVGFVGFVVVHFSIFHLIILVVLAFDLIPVEDGNTRCPFENRVTVGHDCFSLLSWPVPPLYLLHSPTLVTPSTDNSVVIYRLTRT
jgi:hypothetical protein